MKILNLVILLLSACSASAQNTIDFLIGDAANKKTHRFNDQETALSILKVSPYGTRAYVKKQGEEKYYLLSRTSVYVIDPVKEAIDGGYQIGETLTCPKRKCESPWWTGRWNEDEQLEKDIRLYPSNSWNYWWADTTSLNIDFMGCILDRPLRIGDLDGDGIQELLVYLPNLYSADLILFSTKLNKTIFASKVNYNDVISNDKVDQEIVSIVPKDKRYQFWNRWGAELERPGGMHIGYRAFAKLYVGDFDKNGAFDILVWRKLYESRHLEDSIKGFVLKSEMYGYYELKDGEYVLQKTESNTIKKWLSEKKLTWQAGYPTKSECGGQEGQLIPEMHDTLLNDPDVLK